LGNPGDNYSKTRHNAGFLTIDSLSEKYSVRMKKPFFGRYLAGRLALGGNEAVLIKPLTFMNRSGIVFPRLMRKYGVGVESVVVICDNMDLPYGMCRVKKGGSHGGHNGLRSIVESIGDSGFIRIFVGIGRPSRRDEIVEYVLSSPPEDDFPVFMSGVEKAGSAAGMLLTNPLEEVMHEYNRRVKRQNGPVS